MGDLYESGIYEHDEIVEEIDGMLEGEPFSLQTRQMNENLKAPPAGGSGANSNRGRRGSRELNDPAMIPKQSKDLRNTRRSVRTDLALDAVDKAPGEYEGRKTKTNKNDRAVADEWG